MAKKASIPLKKLSASSGFKKRVGAAGENYAAEYLLNNGYRIIERNATSRWGELDIIAQNNNTIVFVEVKTRTAVSQPELEAANETYNASQPLYGSPFEAVTPGKLQRLQRAIQYYILVHKLQDFQHRMDVISVYIRKDGTLLDLKHYQNVTQ